MSIDLMAGDPVARQQQGAQTETGPALYFPRRIL